MPPRFSLADWVIELPEADAGPVAAIARQWAPFASLKAAQLTVRVEWLPAVARPPGWVPSLPDVQPRPDGALDIAGDGFRATLSAARSELVLQQVPERFPLEATLKVCLADHLLSRNGLLVHGVALSAGADAALFTGPSGAGKSTLGSVGVAGGLRLLSDELVAVRLTDDGPIASGTPWNVGAPVMARLKVLGLLAHAAAPTLEPHPAPEVLRVLLLNCLMPDPSSAGRARMFRLASDLVSRVRPARLAFAIDPNVADVLRGGLTP